jgi:hypothetical protein
MLLWYVCLGFAMVGLAILIRRRDLRFAHGVAAAAAMVLVFALIQGNVGTLLRSRAMVIPLVLVLTGVGIDAALRRWPRLIPARVRALMRDGDAAR